MNSLSWARTAHHVGPVLSGERGPDETGPWAPVASTHDQARSACVTAAQLQLVLAAHRRGEPERLRERFGVQQVGLLELQPRDVSDLELYARHRANGILVGIAACVVGDGATISYGVNPPFLWQHLTGHYTNISVHTAGDRVQSAEGMTADVTLEDVRLQDSGDSQGTIGSLDATLTWRSEGIKDTVAANLPGVGALVTGVSTDPGAGTIILQAGSASVTAKPVVAEGDLNPHVLDVTGPFPRDAVQTALDDLTRKLNDNYPLGIEADSVEVTESGVIGRFSSRNASIPREDANRS